MQIQNEPVEEGHDDATDAQKIDGIVEQTKQDALQGHVTDAADALGQRLHDAGLKVDATHFAELLARVTS